MRVTRHFLTIGTRRVHYTRAGDGPAVCLLHASPCSAKVLRQPQEVLAGSFCALAFDTPGFGLSDLLPLEQPEIEDFADALAEALTELGVGQTATYGRHTGASIAVEFARRHAARCSMALTDGFPVFTAKAAEERLKRYLLPIVPQWDGTHLVWLWYRYRDQHVFWPWHNQTLAFRADTDAPDAEFNHRGVVELLEAGDGYRIGYSAAFRHAGLAMLPELTVPVCFGNRPGDSQHRTMAQYPPEAWQAEMPRDPLAAAAAERAILLRHPARGSVPPAPPATPIAGRSTTNYLDIDGAQVLVRVMGDVRAAPPLVIAPHVPGSSARYETLIVALGADIPVVAFDPPGHGESDPLPDGAQSPEAWAETLWAVCDALGVGQAHLLGHNAGAATVVAAAAARPDRALSVILDGPIALHARQRAEWAPRWAPDVLPAWDGTHLLRMWHMRRDMGLWFPWFDRTLACARKAEPRLEPERLQEEIREVAKNPASFGPAWQAAIAWPLPERLAQLPHRVALIAAEADLFGECLDLAAAMRPEVTPLRYGEAVADRAAAIRAALA
ncbi:alpha/beta fold hydrolase [Roseomonas sp. AR75]|uniref:alpha/beta fold hydrolase n=1 Tax=Roseomonas sp. AR75 TaxID=2562311 RepID=UPI0010BF7CCB|nr:alpha/beta hydrolase [Roseomonas sp. AR75]